MNLVMWTVGMWWFYRIVMRVVKKRDQLYAEGGWQNVTEAYVLVVVFAIMDVAYNVAVGSIIFLELPRELLFTTRLQRHRKQDGIMLGELSNPPWRYKLATFICTKLLNPHDPDGNHC